MKYPKTLHLTFEKKPAYRKKEIVKTLTKLFKMNKIKIARKCYDWRSGIEYSLTNVKEYDQSAELELTRVDSLEKNAE